MAQKVSVGITRSGVPGFFTGHFMAFSLHEPDLPETPEEAEKYANRLDIFEFEPTDHDDWTFSEYTRRNEAERLRLAGGE